ncbi:MAG: hypothetical protein JO321_10635 [Solirubrobacterales bacterium]|nr:hypothetical protein [Solirubrobacterales bacterium]MBV9535854.1 hypothetical protein [Solirubrobacterales bacterium]
MHCAAVHPYRVFRAREATGIANTVGTTASWATGMFFAIPLERITHQPVACYSAKTLWINAAPNEDVPDVAPVEEFERFDPVRYRELADVPDAHVAYLRRMKQLGRRPLMFVHIPHIFVAGPIDVSGLHPIAWDEPPRAEQAQKTGSVPE